MMKLQFASMGPRSVERGKAVENEVDDPQNPASMGPRSVERGKQFTAREIRFANGLQWGRVLLNAESAWWARAARSSCGFNGAAFC